jgi:hypothetical protein
MSDEKGDLESKLFWAKVEFAIRGFALACLICVILVMLSACASVPVTAVSRIPCILPSDLEKQGVVTTHEVKPYSLEDALTMWAQDREGWASEVRKHQNTVEFVGRECK